MKVTIPESEEEEAAPDDGGEAAESEAIEDIVSIASNVSYLAPFLRFTAMLHTFIAFAIMVAYYHLKIPLVIFKREKEVCSSSCWD